MAIVAQPFVKWAGGKRHLLGQLETLLPDNFDELEFIYKKEVYKKMLLNKSALLVKEEDTIEQFNEINKEINNSKRKK